MVYLSYNTHTLWYNNNNKQQQSLFFLNSTIFFLHENAKQADAPLHARYVLK